MTDDLTAAISELWLTVAPTARTRVDLLEDYITQLTAGTDDESQRAAAVAAAHKLAGALGSFLQPGSEDAAALEELLRSDAPCRVADLVPLVGALRVVVGTNP